MTGRFINVGAHGGVGGERMNWEWTKCALRHMGHRYMEYGERQEIPGPQTKQATSTLGGWYQKCRHCGKGSFGTLTPYGNCVRITWKLK